VHRARGYFVEHDHPVVGAYRTPRVPFLMERTPSSPAPAPLLGQHNDEVLGGLLGLSPERRAELQAAGVTG
jgi:crotonobetainyl-CoA:carnitine CoA-transferase CaiB-like acyl-CoA transferase